MCIAGYCLNVSFKADIVWSCDDGHYMDRKLEMQLPGKMKTGKTKEQAFVCGKGGHAGSRKCLTV